MATGDQCVTDQKFFYSRINILVRDSSKGERGKLFTKYARVLPQDKYAGLA